MCKAHHKLVIFRDFMHKFSWCCVHCLVSFVLIILFLLNFLLKNQFFFTFLQFLVPLLFTSQFYFILFRNFSILYYLVLINKPRIVNYTLLLYALSFIFKPACPPSLPLPPNLKRSPCKAGQCASIQAAERGHTADSLSLSLSLAL